MLTIKGPPQRLGCGPSRRDFLQVGALGCLGLSVPALLRAGQSGKGTFGRARRCVLLFLTGGPPQLDTWDLKPNAPPQIRGELKPIATALPGTQISELFPKIARHVGKLCIVRSVTHGDRTHTSAGYTMLTGVPHPAANAPDAGPKPTPDDHPHVGAILAKVRSGKSTVPTFVAIPEIIKDAAVNTFPGQTGGLLGNQYSPFLIEANNERSELRLPDVFLPHDVTADRLGDRRHLLGQLDRGLRWSEERMLKDMDVWQRKAFDAVSSPEVRRAFDLGREPAALRERYGRHLFGQGCLLARRLLEAGVGLVTVYWHYEGPDDSPVWDTHQNNFAHLRQRLMPPTDDAFSALLDDLAGRGMLDDTLVVCMGEFGRTPMINKHAGRDHWSAAQSVALAGAGIRAGTTYGATDRDGGYPADKPVSPADFTATLLHVLGVSPELEIHDRGGRPLRACHGARVTGILS